MTNPSTPDPVPPPTPPGSGTSGTPGAPGAPTRAGRREWTALGVLMLPLLLVSMDVSVLYFAIPQISADLEPTGTQQLWIFDMYAFVLAGLLMTMGSLGDRIGRRRLLLIGAVAFGAASLVAAYADSAETLIAARAVLGIGGATLMPSTLAIVRTLFTDQAQRSKAIGLWSGVMTAGVALGSVMSGVLVEHFWWGSVFLVNLPAMVLLLILGPILLPESKNPAPGRFDLLSVPLSMAAVLPVIYGLKEIPSEGWNVRYVLSVTIGLLFAALFVHRQRTIESPMIPPSLFRGRGFAPAVSLNLLSSFGMMGSALFTTQYLQSVLGKSSMEAALWGLLPTVLVGVAAPVSAQLVQRGVNRAYVVSGGFVLGGLRLRDADGRRYRLAVAGPRRRRSHRRRDRHRDVPDDGPGAGHRTGGEGGRRVLGPGDRRGVRRRAGHGTPRFHRHRGVPPRHPGRGSRRAHETLGTALAVAPQLPGRAGDALVTAAREAFTSGMQAAAVAGAVLLLAAAVLAAMSLRQVRVRETKSVEPEKVCV